jgi:hypothetical protein
MASFNKNTAVSSIVDDWMKDSQDLIPVTYADEEVAALDANTVKGRSGLGFEHETSRGDGSRIKNDVLLDKLKKSEKKRKREEAAQLQPSHALSHGLVEEDEEFESRIHVVSALGKKSSETAHVAGANKNNNSNKGMDKGNQNKKVEKKEGNSKVTAQHSETNVHAPLTKSSVPSTANNAANSDKSLSEDTSGVKKRKRIKTRSKQKNIRRDNRPDDQKPTHLKFGSKEYKGRPITFQTREKLGFPEKKTKLQHVSQPNQAIA